MRVVYSSSTGAGLRLHPAMVAKATATRKKTHPRRTFQDMRAIVVSHLTDEDFGPDVLAEASGMSYHQMYRALRDELQMTPSRFIRGVRVECAAELLRQGMGSVTEVAYAVGFEALSHFSRAYRERFGVAPSAHVRA